MRENSEKLGICDPRKLRMCGQRKYNCKNCVSILYSENLVPQKFPRICYNFCLQLKEEETETSHMLVSEPVNSNVKIPQQEGE